MKDHQVAKTNTLVSPKVLPWLFSLTAFVGASLIFLVQPLAAKLLLPSFGGAATVWATSSLFFQVVLLFGYILVHYTSKLGPRRQSAIHLPLLVLALIALPIALPDNIVTPEENPVMWVIRTLAVMVILPFIVLSTTGPLVQKWYSWSNGPRNDDPYFIYAASNVGSFLGLLSYPFLIEPFISLDTQKTLWAIGFAIFSVLLIICGSTVIKAKPLIEKAKEVTEKITLPRYAKWIALAFLPSSLMLGVTTHLTTDVASIPLLWVIPLAIYLATMVGAFASKRRTPIPGLTEFAVLTAIIAIAVSIQTDAQSLFISMASSFLALGTIAYAAHSHLAVDRPTTGNLTKYFVAISFGGALGGLLNGFLAPTIFSKPLEYYLVFASVGLLLLLTAKARPVIVACIVLVMASAPFIQDTIRGANIVYESRTFYGSYKLEETEQSFVLTHGTTIHGEQFKGARGKEPVAYYAKSGPLGTVFDVYGKDAENVTVVGLGAGTMLPYSTSDQTWTYVEIDPEVVKIAENPSYFTYLRDAKAQVNMEVKDGRIAIGDLPNNSQDLIILDAFSSDSIPVHLLTQEAIDEYSEKLTDDGVIVIHISNRIFDLTPVIVSNAKAIDGRAVFGKRGEFDSLGYPSTWMVIGKDKNSVADLKTTETVKWQDITDIAEEVRWTDDYSSVLKVIAEN